MVALQQLLAGKTYRIKLIFRNSEGLIADPTDPKVNIYDEYNRVKLNISDISPYRESVGTYNVPIKYPLDTTPKNKVRASIEAIGNFGDDIARDCRNVEVVFSKRFIPDV